jgi:hypothetical protein
MVHVRDLKTGDFLVEFGSGCRYVVVVCMHCSGVFLSSRQEIAMVLHLYPAYLFGTILLSLVECFCDKLVVSNLDIRFIF